MQLCELYIYEIEILLNFINFQVTRLSLLFLNESKYSLLTMTFLVGDYLERFKLK